MLEKLNNEIKELIKNFDKNKLNEINLNKNKFAIDMGNVYLTLYTITNHILEKFYGSDLKKKHAINIRALVKDYGIDIIEKEMRPKYCLFFNQIEGYLDVFDYRKNEFEFTIYIDYEIDELSKRYVIAHEFSHYILEHINFVNNNIEFKREIKYRLNVLFSKDIEENICDIMAAFFLMPINTVFLLMKEYIEVNNTPIRMNEWLQYLSCNTRISNYHVNLCFQHIRYLGNFLYNNNFKGIDGNIVVDNIESIKDMFC